MNSEPGGRRLAAKTRILTLVVVLSNVIGNLALNQGMKHRSTELTFSPLSALEILFNPWVGLGIALLILWLLSRMALLSWADLSYVLPVTSIGYVLAAVAGMFFFGERISPARWAGTLLITGGIVLVGRTRPNTTAVAPVAAPAEAECDPALSGGAR